MGRKLRPEEVELWKQVTDRTERLEQGRTDLAHAKAAQVDRHFG